MKLILQTPHLIEAQSLMDFLDFRGIESFIMNENGAFYAQGLAHSENMPEVWVAEAVFEKAFSIKKDWIQHVEAKPPI